MMLYRHRSGLRGAALVLVVVAACTESSRRTPTTPSTPTVFTTRLELSGPRTVALGQTGQFMATALQSDGSTRDVTAEATWFSNRSDILVPRGGGVFSGASNGEGSISARLPNSNRNATLTVIVVPEGTFRLTGTVRDTGVPVDALVRIESRSLARVDIPTNAGNYTIYGVAGDTRLTAIKDGYHETKVDAHVTDHGRIDLDILPSRSRPEVSGNYRLTVRAASGCAALPDEARERSYQASVEQVGPALTVTLTGPEFVVDRGRQLNRFTGFVEPTRAVFQIKGPLFYYYYYDYSLPDVTELLSPGRFYLFDGAAIASIASDRLSGTLSGFVRVRSTVVGVASRRCESTDHTIVFER